MKLQVFLSWLCSFVLGKEKPNIVLVVADDLGYSDVNWNNKAINTTPFMEKISESKNAARLVNSYSTHRCSPSRAALLSGIYPFRYGLGKAAIKSLHLPIGIDPELELLPSIVKKSGYSTHLVGKWHLGQSEPNFHPLNRGFDSFYGFMGAEMDYKKHTLGNIPVLQNQNEIIHRGRVYSTFDFTNKTDEILSSNKDDPKFIYLSYNAPHVPVSAPKFLVEQMREEYRNKIPDNGDFWREKFDVEHSGDDTDTTGSADEDSGSGAEEDKGPFTDELLTYHAAIRAIDMGMKQLISKAKSLKRETIFIFTSDNGAITWFNWSWTSGQRERTGCNYPYKGIKSDLTEGGTKVPTFVYSTKRKFAKRKFTDLIHFVDWFPTIVKLTGQNVSTELKEKMDGISAEWIFKGRKKPKAKNIRRNFIYGVKHEFIGEEWVILYSLRYGVWKYQNYAKTYRHFSCPLFEPDWLLRYKLQNLPDEYKERFENNTVDYPVKYNEIDFDQTTLFNMKNDPFEIKNLMEEPSKFHLKLVKVIRKWMQAELDKNTPLPLTGNNVEDAPKLLAALYEPQSYQNYMLQTGRFKNDTICQYFGTQRTESCWDSIIQGLNFTETALQEDYKAMESAYNLGGASKRKIRRLTKTFPYCQDWRKSAGLETDYKTKIN